MFDKILTFKDKLGITKEEKEIKSLINKKSLQKYERGYQPHTKVQLFTDEDGEMKLKWEKSNMMVLAGGGFLARTLFGLTDVPEITPSYNMALNLDESDTSESGRMSDIKVLGFCVGTDGCGRENSQIFAPKYASWISPTWTEEFGGIVPIEYRPNEDDLAKEQRAIYNGRKQLSNYIAYYFKKFSSDPIFSQQYLDGTPISSDVYENISRKDTEVETVVTMTLDILKSDVRGAFYYGLNGQTINDCRINTISLVMGWTKINSEGYEIWQSVRPLTRLNFSNESLIDLRKSIQIRYSIYL